MATYNITATEEAIELIVELYGNFDNSHYENYQMNIERDSKEDMTQLLVTANLPGEEDRVPILVIDLEKN